MGSFLFDFLNFDFFMIAISFYYIYFLFKKRINEDLNSVFVRYERFKKSRPKIDDDVAPLAADPCPTGLLVDIGDSNQGSGNQGPPAGTPSTPGQVNEEFWLNMTDPNPNTEPMGQSEFDKFWPKVNNVTNLQLIKKFPYACIIWYY